MAVPVIYHFDKIVFRLAPGAQLAAVKPADQPALIALPHDTELDIKVRDNPALIADLKGRVLSFLGAQLIDSNRQAIKIESVLYATAVCNPKGW